MLCIDSNGILYYSLDYGATMATTSKFGILTTIVCCAISYTGQIQTVCTTGSTNFVSVDYGVTWTPYFTNKYWKSVVMSNDGKYIICSDISIYTGIYDTNAQAHQWTTNSLPYAIANLEIQISMSFTGKYISYGVVYTNIISNSNNYGVSWFNPILSPTLTSSLVNGVFNAISSDGKYVIITIYYNNTALYIYESTDYGQTFKRNGIVGNSNNIFVSISGIGNYACLTALSATLLQVLF